MNEKGDADNGILTVKLYRFKSTKSKITYWNMYLNKKGEYFTLPLLYLLALIVRSVHPQF